MSSRIEPLVTVAMLEALPDDGNRYELIETPLLPGHALPVAAVFDFTQLGIDAEQ
jgi:hypothetical protein